MRQAAQRAREASSEPPAPPKSSSSRSRRPAVSTITPTYLAPSAGPRENSGLESTRHPSREPARLSARADPPLPLDAAVWASTGSATDRRPHVVRPPIQCVAGLVPKTAASASAERRCNKDGDDHGDDSGAGDEQSTIHG
jgi:hypothetical protein